MNDREACLILNMLSVGPVRLAALQNLSPEPAGIFALPERDLLQVPGVNAALARKILHWEEQIDLDKELKLIERGGVKLLIQTDSDYPAPLKEIHNAPVCLYVRGTLPENLNSRSIAMVGTRNVTHYCETMGRRLAEAASYAGWVVVSGLAVGVDTIVHRATVNAGGKTVAVLGGGMARLHPQENLQLARDIVATGGAIISEFPMTMSPARYTFPMRNRIISGLTQGTVVVEAGLNSGSLITAALAIEQGKRVFAVPGNADSGNASGCNALIRKGAVLTETFEHILEEFDFLPGFDSIHPGLVLQENSSSPEQPLWGAGSSAESDIQLGPVAESILTALKKEDMSLETLSVVTGESAQDLMASAIALEITSRIKRNPDGSYRRLR